jgi:hypothetical protein
MHEKPLRTIVVVQWQGNKKAKRDGSKAKRKETKEGKMSSKGNRYLINFDGHYAVLFGYFRNCKHRRV